MIAVRADRLFDGTSDQPLPRAVVLVDDGVIAKVGADDAPPPGAEVIELGDLTLLPGLVDSHTHLVFDASDDPVGHLASSADDAVRASCRSALRTALAAGITTARDLGDRDYLTLDLRAEMAADPVAGPQLRVAGPPITSRGGHCWFLGGEAEGINGVRARREMPTRSGRASTASNTPRS